MTRHGESGAHTLRFSYNRMKTINQMHKKLSRSYLFYLLGGFLTLTIVGCGTATYPPEKVESAIKEICKNEYKVEDVEVKFAGKTIGVFLPLRKLFTTDVRQEILSGNVSSLDSLFEPEPQAMEQLENVLFTISRVLLSSDKEIDFYILQATDVESTGLQLVLMGYVPDVRRVRLWDISRTEYRKRVLHELKFNRAALWEKPVRGLFKDASHLGMEELGKLYFSIPPSPETISPLFYSFLSNLKDNQKLSVEISEIKSRAYRDAKALVYAKIRQADQANSSHTVSTKPAQAPLEYIFVVEPSEPQFKIEQVLPFYYLNEAKQLQKIQLPPDLDLARNLKSWPERFSVDEIVLGEFLVRQMNRRIQALLSANERIHHTIRQAQINFAFRSGTNAQPKNDGSDNKPYFALYFDLATKEMTQPSQTIDQLISDEDILYLFELVLREFSDVIRSYQFKDFNRLELIWQQGNPPAVLKLDPDQLDLFREKKLNIAALLSAPF
ncbi:MAG: hypothetical protein A3C35_00090 [Omnitrophica bacterium RIFCSPHIGHO2_02_FULL_46_11]|nr:MAG: hypothetical protein A3C35_00090 [Omnitrophica bacterium RIFCSPHIGHO2_02_FULL_46_11]OGW87559.1 MAG: hypothetical protein A3A81_03315 [Omnitrophica bacterium RIFCSPLOWO2_01_FULL_45_10b]